MPVKGAKGKHTPQYSDEGLAVIGELQAATDDLRPEWRLENLTIYAVTKEKTTTKGETRTYHYWHASWRGVAGW